MVQVVVLMVCRLVQGEPMGPVLPACISKVTGPEESPFAVVMVRRKLAKVRPGFTAMASYDSNCPVVMQRT